MNAFFHGAHGAARSYLFSKVFLLLLALDAWALMIGHAGRYGAAGFNVAHFEWLDRLQPMPTAGSYIAVLLLAGMLSLTLMLLGVVRPLMFVLFLLYTYSWAMSMLDSYQHHYLVSIILACLIFFPKTAAKDIHPLLPPPLESEGARKRHARDRERFEQIEKRGWTFAALGLAIIALYALIDPKQHVFALFFACAGALALCTWLVAPAVRKQPVMAQGFGFNLLGVTVSIVYVYTAIAKIEPAWLGGHTIQQIGSAARDMTSLVQLAAAFGLSSEQFWSLFATAVIPQELFMGFAYLCAVVRDQEGARFAGVPRKLLERICWIAVPLAIALHVGAEAMGLEIGWFSHYMLLFAASYLLPIAVVDKLVIVLTWPGRRLSQLVDEWELESPGKLVAIATVLGASALVVGAGYSIDLPGAFPTGLIAAAVLVLVALGAIILGKGDPRRFGVAAALAAGLMWLAISQSPVRWEYYRFRAGDLDKRGETEAALYNYEKSEQYAPPGETRIDKIKKLRRKLGKSSKN